MNADTLRKLGVPEANLAAALKIWKEEHVVEGAHSAALALRLMIDQMPPERQAVAEAALGRLTLQAAARRAECSVKTLRRAVARREIKASRNATGRVSLDRQSFREWLRKRLPRGNMGQMVDKIVDNVDTAAGRPLTA